MRVFFMPKNRIFIAIDGSNFYYKLKKLGFKNLSKFNFEKFTSYLASQEKRPSKLNGYYIGIVREEVGNPKSIELKKGQDKFLAKLAKQPFTIKRGYILKSGREYFEKGVDVQIAVDMCMKAARDEYDQLILVSSDTDLIPAIREVKSLRKTVEYVGFGNSPSFALIRFSDTRRLLLKEDLQKFFE